MDDKETKFEEYKILLQVRNFHYENFNKWMTFYYIAVGSIFIALYSGKLNEIKCLIIIMGVIISTLWHFSCKGYYFWVINWSKLINKLEDDNKIEIHSVFSKDIEDKYGNIFSYLNPLTPANFSTSKLTLLFSYSVSIFWLYLLIKKMFSQYICCSIKIQIMSLLSSLLIQLIIITISSYFLKSNIKQHKKI